MKILKTIALLLLAGVMLTGCAKNVEKVLIKKEGTWTVVFQRVQVLNENGDPVFDLSENNAGTMQFIEGGTGISTDNDNNTSTFEWSWSKDNDRVSITDDQDQTLVYDILECSKDAFKVRSEETTVVFGAQQTTIIDVELERAE